MVILQRSCLKGPNPGILGIGNAQNRNVNPNDNENEFNETSKTAPLFGQMLKDMFTNDECFKVMSEITSGDTFVDGSAVSEAAAPVAFSASAAA